MNNTALRFLFAGIVIASTLFVFVTSVQLPDPVASQFDMGGKATNHMSRDAFQAFMTGMTLAVPLLLLVFQVWLPRVATRLVSIPKRDYWLATPERRAQMLDYLERHTLISGIAPPLFFAAMQWAIIEANARVPPQFDNTFLLAAGGLFVAWVIAAAVTLSLHFRRSAVTRATAS
jgi:hypothetical protein